MTPEERARSLLLPISAGAAETVPRERVPEPEPDDAGSVGIDTVFSTIEYPGEIAADLVIVDDNTWCLLYETSKLALNTLSFSFVF